MRPAIGALLATLALAGTAAGCGGDDSTGDVVPRSTPELTAPPDVQLGSGSGSSTGTTDTTTTDTTTTPNAPATQAPSAPASPAPSAPQTGGAAPPGGTGGGTGGGAAPETGGASPGAFSEFCRQNPGACPDQ